MVFELEQKIDQWKRSLLASGHLDEGEVEEMEDHLRAVIEKRVEEGTTEREAFAFACKKVGRFDAISDEYGKAKFSGRLSLGSLLLPDMFLHYLKTATRALSKNKVNNFLLIACLGIGLMCVFFISHFIAFHRSVDHHYSGKGLFRITYHVVNGDHEGIYPNSPVPLGPTVKGALAGVKNVVRVWMSSPVLEVNDELFYEDVMIFTDPSFFQFFELPLVLGDPQRVLSQPNTVVISEEMASKFFGAENPIGQVIRCDGYPSGKVSLVVSGVFASLKENTHLDFHLAASLVKMDTEKDNWGSFKPIWTYVNLEAGGDLAFTEQQLNGLVDKYMPYRREDAEVFTYALEPVEDIHIRSEVAGAMKPAIDASLLWTMGAIGLLILGLSCINYINLSLAQLYNQFREVGIRKVFGATPAQVRQRFFVSGLLTLTLGIGLGAVLVWLLRGRYEALSGLSIFTAWTAGGQDLGLLLAGSLLVCLIAIYLPGVRLAHFNANGTLKGRTSAPRSQLHGSLVIVQFVLSSVLLVGTLLMQDQIQYIFDREVGVDSEYVVAIQRPPRDQAFQDALAQNPDIQSFAYSQLLPLNEMSYDGRRIQRPGDPTNYSSVSSFASPSFLTTYNIQLLAGRTFEEGRQADSAAFIINEQAVEAFGLGSPAEALGATLVWSGDIEGRVIGVIRDFNLRSLHEAIGPLVLLRAGDYEWYNRYLSVKVPATRQEETLRFLRKTFEEYADGVPFDYFFIDDSYEQIHAEDLNFSRLAIVFSSIAIIIALMGLFGLVNIDLNKLMKEIGIRKVLGSSVAQIFVLIGAGYVKRVALAFLISVPVAIYCIRTWLEQYAYRTDIQISTILLGGLLILLITWITISWKVYRAATVNPSVFLREE